MNGLAVIFAVVACYLLGCFNGAIVVSKYILRDDIRKHGSGNAGLTNFHRTFGGGLTFAVIASDAVKMILAVVLGNLLLAPLMDTLVARLLAGALCVLGHSYPIMFGFKGGKGILSGGTLALFIDWRVALMAWGVFLLAVVLTRWVSLGSVLAGIFFALGVLIFFPQPWPVFLATVTGALLVWRHKENIARLIAGTEPKFSFHRKKEGAQ